MSSSDINERAREGIMGWDRLKRERNKSILTRLDKGESLRSIARDFGMSHEAIRYIRRTKGEKQMMTEFEGMQAQKWAIQEKQNKPIRDALDALALALTNHNHVWTNEERSLYESAIVRLQVPASGSEYVPSAEQAEIAGLERRYAYPATEEAAAQFKAAQEVENGTSDLGGSDS